ncbi:MAG: hypothetical protein ACHQRJ_25140 [Alphaproteobacteria bacterium]
MTAFRFAHSNGPSSAEAAKECAAALRAAGPIEGPGEALGFLYAGDAFASELADILLYLRAETGVGASVRTLCQHGGSPCRSRSWAP